MNHRRWPRILPRPDYPVYQNNGSLPLGFTYQHNHVRSGGNNVIPPSSFYHNCAKFERMNNNDKHPCNKQTKERFCKHETHNRVHSGELLPTEDTEEPMVHQDLSQALPPRCLSYRFPDQSPESLQKLCFPSLKRKHGELVTTSTNQAQASKGGSPQKKIAFTNKNGGHEKANTHCSSNNSKQPKNDGYFHQSRQHNSILPIYDKNRNFMVVKKENSDELSASAGKVEKQILPKASLNRFENDPEEDTVQLLSFSVQGKGKVENSGKDKFEEQKMDNRLTKQNDVSLHESADDPVLSCTDQGEEINSDAESEVFDDVFLKNINKELDNEVSNSFSEEVHDLKEQTKSVEAEGSCNKENVVSQVSCAEGSTSPTFDSPLSRFLEDNAGILRKNEEIEVKNIGSDIRNKLPGRESNSSGNGETVCEGKMPCDYLNERGSSVDNAKENDTVSKNPDGTIGTSPMNKKGAETYLQFQEDSSLSTAEVCKSFHAEAIELIIPIEIKLGQVDSACVTTDNHTGNEKDNKQEDGCTQEKSSSTESTSDVEEAIRLIRAVKSSVKVFESLNPLEMKQQKTKNEDNVPEVVSNNENKDNKQMNTEENNGAFQPLCESLVLSVNKEVQKIEETSEIGLQCFTCNNSQGVNKDTGDPKKNLLDENICSVIDEKAVSCNPSEVDNTSTYDRLHLEVLASKMADFNKPPTTKSSNVDEDVGFKDTSYMPMSNVEDCETLDLERPCQVEKDDIDYKDPGEPDDSVSKVTEAVAFEKNMQLSKPNPEPETKVENRNASDTVSPIETSNVIQDNNLYEPAAPQSSESEVELSKTSDYGRQEKASKKCKTTETDKNDALDIEKSKAFMIAVDQVVSETSGQSKSDIEISSKISQETLNGEDNEELTSKDVELSMLDNPDLSEVEQAVLSISQNKLQSFFYNSVATESEMAVISDYKEIVMPELGAGNQLEGQGILEEDLASNGMDFHGMVYEGSQILNDKKSSSVIESNSACNMNQDEAAQTCIVQKKAAIESNKNSDGDQANTVSVGRCLINDTREDATIVEELSNQQRETSTETVEHEKNKVGEDSPNISKGQDCNDVKLGDAVLTETPTSALVSKLRELKKNFFVQHLLVDILAKNTQVCSKDVEANDNNEKGKDNDEGRTDENEGPKRNDETTQGKDSFDDTPFLSFSSGEIVVTDSEHSSTSVEELYVQNLITKASALSDSELESTSHENSDIESNEQFGTLKAHEESFIQNTETLENITQENKSESETSTLQDSSQGNESTAAMVASLRVLPRTSNMEQEELCKSSKNSVIESHKRRCARRRSRFRLTRQRNKSKNVKISNGAIHTNKRRSNRLKKVGSVKKDSWFNNTSNISSREIPYCPELYMKKKDKRLSKVFIKLEKDSDFEEDTESAEIEVDNDDCLSEDDFHLELNLLDDISDTCSLGIQEKNSSSNDDTRKNSTESGSNSTRVKFVLENSFLGNSIADEVCKLGGSTANNVCGSLGMSTPDEVCLVLASSIPSKNISSTLDDGSVERSDVTSPWSSSSSSSTTSQDIEDPNCQSSTSTEDKRYSSTSTAIITSKDLECSSQGTRTSEDSLKITLYTEKNPSTGTTNRTANTSPVKLTKPIVKKEPFSGYKLRRSKTRKNKKLLPTAAEPLAKRRRMTITDLREGSQSPMSLLDLTKKPLENYIRTVEGVYRAPEKNSKKGLLAISMKDRVDKISSQDQEGDCLKLGDTEVMFEIVKKAFGESKIKRCRPSPRSLYFAAKQGNVLQVLILAAGCNVNATIPQERHKTAMHAAASAGHADVLGILALVGGNLSSLDTKLQTPLFDAVEHQQTDVVKFLISQDVNLNLKDSQGMTVLHVAAQKSHVDIIDLLMKTGKLDVNEQDNGGWTALMWTAESMRMEAAKCLLKWGADVNVLDIEQNTCLHWAALSGGAAIMDLLLKANVDIDARNVFGATALHISARERKLPNITILAKYRPNLDIKNADGKRAIELVPLHSKCHIQLKRMEMLMSFAKYTLRERLITSDVSRGQEQRPIPCVNEVDDETLPDDFVYVSNNLAGQSHCFDRSLSGCNCSDGCVNEKKCECAQLSARKRFWFDETGCINSEIFQEDRPLVYECNMKCKCWSNCHQRVVQRGITAGLQLYKTKEKGWAVRTQALIPKGTFVCEYVGEILTDSEADRREDDCYLFDLDVKGQSTLFCLDAKFYGNITRFINHSCDPNILPVRVFTDHQVKNCPRIAFFAARDIKPYEEICSNYGEKFWTVKKSEFNCVCKTTKCKYGGQISLKK